MLYEDPLSHSWSPDVTTLIHQLKNKVDRLASLAFTDAQNDTDEDIYYIYLKNFTRLVDQKYYITSHYPEERALTSKPHFPEPAQKIPSFSEEQSDDCFREILGNEGLQSDRP